MDLWAAAALVAGFVLVTVLMWFPLASLYSSAIGASLFSGVIEPGLEAEPIVF